MKVVKPFDNNIYFKYTLFLAGTTTPAWREVVKEALKDHDIIIYDPISPNYEEGQNALWEKRAIANSDLIIFYFGGISEAPLTLFELGYSLGKGKEMIIFVSPEYKHKDYIFAVTRNIPKFTDFVKFIEFIKREVK